MTFTERESRGLFAPAPRTARLDTHGCKLNQADTQALARRFAEAGYEIVGGDRDDADVYVLNTCTVTHVADRKARQAARAHRRRNPNAIIAVTGCYAERAADDLRAMPEIDLVVGNGGKASLVEMLDGIAPSTACAVGDDSPLTPVLRMRSRAMIKIQEGCDQVCAYCIVPKVRGRERSVPPERIVAMANAYVAAGCQEIVLTGTQLGSYGFDLDGIDIAGLASRLLAESAAPRIRISSLQPQDISDELLELWADSRLCPHFHVPLQSGSDATLARMRRRYAAAEFVDAVRRVREAVPNVSITADAIVGFPGETDADFRRTVEVCVEAELSALHVFPYSIRPGTSAAHFGEQVDAQVKSARAAELGGLARELSAAFRARFIGKSRPTLWERATEDANGALAWSGLTDNYIRVRATTDAQLANRITAVRLVSMEGGWMRAEIA